MPINHQGNNPREIASTSPAKHVLEVTEKPEASKIERSRMVAEAVAQASSVFAAFDKDGDGKVSAAELRGSMTAALGEEVSEEEAAAILATVDADGDGLLDQEEFSRLGLGAAGDDGGAAGGGDDDEEVRRRCLREAFAMYATGGGEEEGARITPASLRRMLGKLLGSEKMGLEECRAMICRFDLNGDGVLSFDEFRVMMMANL
ncbi:hypothetical protein ACQJBY_049170 [Aegilops geniculata]